MTPIKQTILSNPDTGTRGNCFQACLASLLDLPIEKVPDFHEMGTDWADSFYDFLDRNGCYFYGTPSFNAIASEKGIDGYVIVGGTSPRGIISGHSVIYKDGQPFFDPHPSNDFLLEPQEVYSIERDA
jgi:hypothetical protein